MDVFHKTRTTKVENSHGRTIQVVQNSQRKRKRDVFSRWFAHKHQVISTPLDLLEDHNEPSQGKESDTSKEDFQSTSITCVASLEEDTTTESDISTVVRSLNAAVPDESTTPSPSLRAQPFRALFKRKKHSSYINDFQNIDTKPQLAIGKSRTMRSRLFTLRDKNRVQKSPKPRIDDPYKDETTVVSVSETLTQRYMTSYETLLTDMDIVPFDLTVKLPKSVRQSVSAALQSWSPVKRIGAGDARPSVKDSNKTCDGSVIDARESGNLEDEWNPYSTAKNKAFSGDVTINSHKLGRFGTIKGKLSLMFKRIQKSTVPDKVDGTASFFSCGDSVIVLDPSITFENRCWSDRHSTHEAFSPVSHMPFSPSSSSISSADLLPKGDLFLTSTSDTAISDNCIIKKSKFLEISSPFEDSDLAYTGSTKFTNNPKSQLSLRKLEGMINVQTSVPPNLFSPFSERLCMSGGTYHDESLKSASDNWTPVYPPLDTPRRPSLATSGSEAMRPNVPSRTITGESISSKVSFEYDAFLQMVRENKEQLRRAPNQALPFVV